MEKEKIITLTEILDYSEDEEPPSGGEGKFFTFAFACVYNDVLRFPSLKILLVNLISKTRRMLILEVNSQWTNWLYPARGIVVSVFQIITFWQVFNNFKKSSFPHFLVSLYNSFNHYLWVVEYCLVKEFGLLMWTKVLGQKFLGYSFIPSNQMSSVQLITIKNK